MPQLQVTPQTTMAGNKLAVARAEAAAAGRTAPTAAQYATQLQAAHAAAKARARKVCKSEPGVVSKYDLGDVIAELELEQIIHGELAHFAESILLNRIIAKLKVLIPV